MAERIKINVPYTSALQHVGVSCVDHMHSVHTETWPQPLGSKQPKNNCSHTEGNKKQEQGCNIWADMSSAAEMGQFLFVVLEVCMFFLLFFTLSLVHGVYGTPNMHNSRRAEMPPGGLKIQNRNMFFFSPCRPVNMSWFDNCAKKGSYCTKWTNQAVIYSYFIHRNFSFLHK